MSWVLLQLHRSCTSHVSEEQQSEAVRAVEGVGRTIVDRLLAESAKCVPVGVIVCVFGLYVV